MEHCASHEIRMTADSPLTRSALLDDPELIQVGNDVGGSASQVALAWLTILGVPLGTWLELSGAGVGRETGRAEPN